MVAIGLAALGGRGMGAVCRLYGQSDIRIEDSPDEPLGTGDVRVSIVRGGICGSDLHYYQHGGFGPVRVKEPIILGHEIAGIVVESGAGVHDIAVGDKVAVSPSQPCMSCQFCDQQEYQHCENMRFLGSARTTPHVQGGFRQRLKIPAIQCFRVGSDIDLAFAVCAEPLAVCLHAARQAGPLAGRRVLVTGAGPIGVLCCAVAMMNSAAEVTATDLHDAPLAIAKKMGANRGVNIAFEPPENVGTGFDVVFECSAAEAAVNLAITALRPRGTIVQVGVTGNLSLPINALVGKEIVFRGTHRFHPEFADAVRLINSSAIDVSPMLTHCFALSEVKEAFLMASNRQQAMKVQLDFTVSK